MGRRTAFVALPAGLAAAAGLAFLILSAGGAGEAAAQDPAPKDGGLRIGVINLRECLKGERYEWVKQIDAELQEYAEKYTAEQQDLQKQIRDMEDKRGGVPKGGPLYFQCLREEKILKAKLEAAEKVGQLEYANTYTKQKTLVYNEILRVAAIVGRDRGFDLILRADEPLDETELPASGTASQIQRQTVLYNSPRVDVTDEVIQKLNEEHRRRRTEGGGTDQEKPFHCPNCDLRCSTPKCPRCGKALEAKDK